GAARLRLGAKRAQWETLSDATLPGLPNNTVYQIRRDARGRLYLFTNRGVARLTPRRPTRDDPSEFSVYTFTTEDGLPANECTMGASMVDGHGRVWIGTSAGAGLLDPSRELDDDEPKPLHIERVALNGAERPLAPGASLRYDENNLEFEY